MKTTFHTSSPNQTKGLAFRFIKKLLSQPSKRALVIALEGELGSGKTTFVQGIAQALGIKKITSPTFVLMKRYPSQEGRTLYHIDCYRLRGSQDLLELGWKDIISSPQNIILVEWADRMKDILPKDSICIRFKHERPQKRSLKIASPKFGNLVSKLV